VDTSPLEKIRDQLSGFEEQLYHVAGNIFRVCVDVEKLAQPCTPTGTTSDS